MLGGGGHSKTQKIGQTSEKKIHNDLNCNKVNSINANEAININDYNSIENYNYNNNDKNYKINKVDFKNCSHNTDTYNQLVTIKNNHTRINQDTNNTRIDELSSKEEKVLSRVQGLHKRAGLIGSKASRRASADTQHTNTFIRSTVQIVLWLLTFVLSTMLVHFTNVGNNNLMNIQTNIVAEDGTFADEGTRIGDGLTLSTAFQISTYADLIALATLINSADGDADIGGEITYRTAYYRLVGDIGIVDSAWTPIGTATYPFKGTFMGDYHSIIFYVPISITSSSGKVYGGIFGYTKNATIRVLIVDWEGAEDEPMLSAHSTSGMVYAGGIVGYADSTTFENCYIGSGTITASGASYSYAGGIVGFAVDSSISGCGIDPSVIVNANNSAYTYAGGIVGFAYSSITIGGCYSRGDIIASGSIEVYAGGIVGYTCRWVILVNATEIEYCDNYSNISASSTAGVTYAGGIVGYAQKPTTVYKCSNAGTITSKSITNSAYADGIAGYAEDSSTITDCTNTGVVEAQGSLYAVVTFNITTNVGVIFNVYDSDNNFVQQVFVDKVKNNAQQTLTMQLLQGAMYTIRISAFSTANITLDTVNSMSGITISGRTLTFEVGESGNTITMTITGFSGGNGIVV